VANALGFVQRTSNLLKRRRQLLQKSCARSGWRYTLGGPSKKLELQPLLKSPDGVAQGGLGDAQLRGCMCKASLAGDDCKRSEFIQLISHDL